MLIFLDFQFIIIILLFKSHQIALNLIFREIFLAKITFSGICSHFCLRIDFKLIISINLERNGRIIVKNFGYY